MVTNDNDNPFMQKLGPVLGEISAEFGAPMAVRACMMAALRIAITEDVNPEEFNAIQLEVDMQAASELLAALQHIEARSKAH